MFFFLFHFISHVHSRLGLRLEDVVSSQCQEQLRLKISRKGTRSALHVHLFRRVLAVASLIETRREEERGREVSLCLDLLFLSLSANFCVCIFGNFFLLFFM